jgi:hypothetical protein
LGYEGVGTDRSGRHPTEGAEFRVALPSRLVGDGTVNPENSRKVRLFLARGASSYMIGSEVVVDGGFAEL